jgi:hypothetical protein
VEDIAWSLRDVLFEEPLKREVNQLIARFVEDGGDELGNGERFELVVKRIEVVGK